MKRDGTQGSHARNWSRLGDRVISKHSHAHARMVRGSANVLVNNLSACRVTDLGVEHETQHPELEALTGAAFVLVNGRRVHRVQDDDGQPVNIRVGMPVQGSPNVLVGDYGKEKSDNKVWVEIHVMRVDGSPCSGALYRLRLPDGSIRIDRLDEHGHARVDAIPEGSCEVEFPDLDTEHS